MEPSDTKAEFVRQMQRVLSGADASDTTFWTFPATATAEALRPIVAWLRTLPAAIGEQELERRIRERWGPPPGEGEPDRDHSA